MRKSKYLKSVICVVFAALFLTACGQKGSKTVEIDAAKLAGQLQEAVTSGTLTETSSDIALSTYFLDAADVEKITAFMGTGIASEIVVVQRKDSLSADDCEKKLKTHVDNQEELYSSYNQEEAAKLSHAVIKSAGSYTILVVCDDEDKAASILKTFGL